jgi:ketosteroid isomerase-like protein
MKKILFIVFFFSAIQVVAQNALDEMIATEKSFAAYAVANNTKDAFLKFIDTSAVMFEKGEPVKGYESWLKKEKRPGILNWRPRYAEIAASGDFGFTCGPWTFQAQTVSDSIAARGYFFTIWQKKKAGDWKFILDVGTDAGIAIKENDVVKLTTQKGKATENTLREAEEAFQQLYKADENQARKKYMADNVILAGNKQPLTSGNADWKYSATAQPGKMDFKSLGGGIAPSGDLGYDYGTATQDGKKETYLRIWRHELTGWKIAVQLVRL